MQLGYTRASREILRTRTPGAPRGAAERAERAELWDREQAPRSGVSQPDARWATIRRPVGSLRLQPPGPPTPAHREPATGEHEQVLPAPWGETLAAARTAWEHELLPVGLYLPVPHQAMSSLVSG